MASLLSECRFILLPSLPAVVLQWYTSYTVVIVVSAPTARTVVTLFSLFGIIQKYCWSKPSPSQAADLTGCRSTSLDLSLSNFLCLYFVFSFFLLAARDKRNCSLSFCYQWLVSLISISIFVPSQQLWCSGCIARAADTKPNQSHQTNNFS